MTDLYYLSQADGIGEWRMKEAKDLSDLVQNRITYLQVSTDTAAAEPTGLYHFTHKHTQRCRRHNYAVSIDANIFFTQINTHMHKPEISFTLARLICTVHICQHQFAQLEGEWYHSRRFQQLHLTSLLFVSSLVSPTHMRQSTETQSDRSAHVDMRKCKEISMHYSNRHKCTHSPRVTEMHIHLQASACTTQDPGCIHSLQLPCSPSPALVLQGSRAGRCGAAPCPAALMSRCVWRRGPSQSGWVETAPLTAAVTTAEGSHRSTSCHH